MAKSSTERGYEIDSLYNSIRAFPFRVRQCSHDGCKILGTDKWCFVHRDINLRLYLALIK